MQRKKENVWIIITFLLLVFLFTSIIDIHSITESFEVFSIDDKQQNEKLATMPEMIPVRLPQDVIVYKQFSLLQPSSQVSGISFDVNNRWMETARVDPESIELFTRSNSTGNWTKVPLKMLNKYAITTAYSTTVVTHEPYMITGVKDSAPSGEKFTLLEKSIIIGGLIIILLFIGYYSPKNNSARKKKMTSTMATLEAFVKKSLIEGHSDEEIRQSLIASGWDEKSVDEAIHRLRYI